MRLPVLLYHHVGPVRPGANPFLTVSPSVFEVQIRYLVDKGYSTIQLAELAAWRYDRSVLPAKPVLITFDDGYADIAEFALPLLRCYGFTAVVFLVTNYLGRTNFWQSETRGERLRLLGDKEVIKWSGEGMEFGSHSRSHPNLTKLSASQLQDEVMGSRAQLKALFGYRPKAFAYPYGLVNGRVRDCVRAAFEYSFIVNNGFNSCRTDPWLMRRLEIVPGDGLFRFAWLMKLGFRSMRELRERIAPRTRMRRWLAPDDRTRRHHQ